MNSVGPLIDSLRHTMLVKSNALQIQLQSSAIFREAVAASMDSRGFPSMNPRRNSSVLIATPFERRAECAQQRMHLPAGKDARWVVDEYVRWLPESLWFLRCKSRVEAFALFALAERSVAYSHYPRSAGRRTTPC